MFEKEKFRNDVIAKRKKMGVSICQLAKMIGVNKSTISRIENGSECTLRTNLFAKIISWLDSSADDYFSPIPLVPLVKEPKENTPIEFFDMQGNSFEGIYIKAERMFFIGFEDGGKFKYDFEILKWKYLKNRKKITSKK